MMLILYKLDVNSSPTLDGSQNARNSTPTQVMCILERGLVLYMQCDFLKFLKYVF